MPLSALLLDNPRVRAEVVETLYRNSPAGPVVVFAAAAVLWWLYVVPLQAIGVGIALLVWVLQNVGFLALHFVHRAQPLQVRQDASATRQYLRWYFGFCLADSLMVAALAMMLYWARPELVFVPALGIVTYVYGAIVSAMPLTPLITLFPAVILGPISLVFLLSGSPPLQAVAGFFVLNVLGLTHYGRNQANDMLLAIKQRFDLESLAQQLTLERERANAANESKSRFFTAASHDARQPLQAVSLLFQALKMRLENCPQEQHIIEKIGSNLGSIRSLFDRVLDISRIDSGAIAPEFRTVALQPLFDRLDAQFGELAARRGLWLRFAATRHFVMQDEALLERMLSNLVHNALKYTEHGGVWVGWRNSRLRLEVRDTGVGIAPVHHHAVFEEFNRIHPSAGVGGTGLGLGLSIVKRLADLTGARFGLVSALGQGSTFWLRMEPVATVPDGRLASMLPQRQHTAAHALRGLNVLFIEDNPDLLELITGQLRALGATVRACCSPEQVHDALRGSMAIDIILADYRLDATETGLDIIHRVRTVRQCDIPAVLLSGDTAVAVLRAIQQAPQVWLLHKPADFEQIVLTLLRALHRG